MLSSKDSCELRSDRSLYVGVGNVPETVSSISTIFFFPLKSLSLVGLGIWFHCSYFLQYLIILYSPFLLMTETLKSWLELSVHHWLVGFTVYPEGRLLQSLSPKISMYRCFLLYWPDSQRNSPENYVEGYDLGLQHFLSWTERGDHGFLVFDLYTLAYFLFFRTMPLADSGSLSSPSLQRTNVFSVRLQRVVSWLHRLWEDILCLRYSFCIHRNFCQRNLECEMLPSSEKKKKVRTLWVPSPVLR